MRRNLMLLLAALQVCLGETPIELARKQVVADLTAVARQSAITRRAIAGPTPGANIAPFLDTVQDQAVVGSLATYFATLAVNGSFGSVLETSNRKKSYAVLANLIEARADKQVGSTDGNQGSTSVALKGIAPDILGFAAEHGAITREQSGNTVTFRGSPAGLVKTLQGKGLLDIYTDYENSPEARFLRRFSFAASFNADDAAKTATAPAPKLQVASWSARAELVNHRDPKLYRYASRFATLAVDPAVPEYRKSRVALIDAVNKWTEYKAWLTALEPSAKALDVDWRKDPDTLQPLLDRFSKLLSDELPKLDDFFGTTPSDVAVKLDAYVEAINPLLNGRSKILKDVSKGTLITADWTTARDASLPDLYTLTGVLEFAPFASSELTINSAWSFYRVEPVNLKRYRDFKLTGQYDRALGQTSDFGPFLFSLAGRYEYIPADTVASGGALSAMISGIDLKSSSAVASRYATQTGVADALKGHLALLQAKLTIPLKGTGLKPPISFTVANRTELIKEKEVRVNFGITLDFDAFLANLKKK